ncbi:unnamed protein product [Rotaria socialis]|uniref:Uncharacterized protein n=1 Tax=Rotaria socialis TaxID=392032 RepID=A0A820VGE9_9BILA|nr:unnamed protein product [Rotaria socialis]CAF4499688.1 unnamed protein product [Rotaria socialis]
MSSTMRNVMHNIEYISKEEQIDQESDGVTECPIFQWKVGDVCHDADCNSVEVSDDIGQENVKVVDDDEVFTEIESTDAGNSDADLLKAPVFSKGGAIHFLGTLNQSSLVDSSVEFKKKKRSSKDEYDNANADGDTIRMKNMDDSAQKSSHFIYSFRKRQRVEPENETKVSEKLVVGNRMVKEAVEYENENGPYDLQRCSEKFDVINGVSIQEISHILDLKSCSIKKMPAKNCNFHVP